MTPTTHNCGSIRTADLDQRNGNPNLSQDLFKFTLCYDSCALIVVAILATSKIENYLSIF